MPTDDPADCEREIFEEALDIESAEDRADFLRRVCGDKAELLERVQALLHAHEPAEGFLPDQPIARPEGLRAPPSNRPADGPAEVLTRLGEILLAQRKPAEADAYLRESLALHQKVAPDDWHAFHTQSVLGVARLEQMLFANAEPMLLEGYEGLKKRERSIPPTSRVFLRRAVERLVRLYEAWGKPGAATTWRNTLEALNKSGVPKP